MKLEHSGLGVSAELKDEILQRDVERYQIALHKRAADRNLTVARMPVSVYDGDLIRALLDSELLELSQDVDAMTPAATRWLGNKLSEELSGLYDVPPES